MNLDAPCELVRDLRAPDERFEIVWSGAHDGGWWREYTALPLPPTPAPRSMMGVVRDYLEDHPHDWLTARQVRTAVEASYDDISDRLCRLVQQGDVERVKGPDGRWQYRLKVIDPREPVTVTTSGWRAKRAAAARWPRKRTVRSPAEYQAMRDRLAQKAS